MATVTLWVRPEAFEHGAIHAPIPPKLALHNLHKLSIYSRNKGKAGYPRLSYTVWKHVACNKLHLTEDQAWLYFETFNMLSDASFKDRAPWSLRSRQCNVPEEIDELRSQCSVRTLPFILFLYIQQIHRISFKASLVSGGEEWPTHSRSPELEKKGSIAVKSLDEHDHMMFVFHHLNEVLELLMEPESSINGGTESCLTIEALDALGFIIAGKMGNKPPQPLHELARLHSETHKNGYSKICRTFAFRQLQSWLRSSLQVNPFGVSAILCQGNKSRGEERLLSLSDTFEEHGFVKQREADQSGSKERIMTNLDFAPPEQKMVILSQVCKQTIAKASDMYAGSSLRIHRCHFSYLYILCPLKSVTVEKCHNSTIVLGVVKTAVNLVGCENVTLITLCNRVFLSGSSKCTLHLCTPERPVILLGNEGLVLAPYHTSYPRLEEHLHGPWGVETSPNQWNNPLFLGAEHSDSLDDVEEPRAVFKEMTPADFFTFSIPFSMKGATEGPPMPLPKKYEEALEEHERIIEEWHKKVKGTSLNKSQRHQLRGAVQHRFQEWLAESGNAGQLNGLLPHHSSKVCVDSNKH